MRRVPVPAVEVAPLSKRLNALLRPPEVAPVYDRELPPLEGVAWPQRGAGRVPVTGEVALFDVTDPGELQGW
jgi:hypothetical protein